MQPNQNYQQLLTDVIKKQIVILGPDITLSKARNVKGLTVSDDGTVTQVTGDPQQIIQALIDQFVQLSGLIVKKTMEPLLTLSGDGQSQPATAIPSVPQVAVPPIPQPTPPTPVAPTTQQPQQQPATGASQPVQQAAPAQPVQQPIQNPQPTPPPAPQQQPAAPATPATPPQPASQPTVIEPAATGVDTQLQSTATGSGEQLQPAKNPLAA